MVELIGVQRKSESFLSEIHIEVVNLAKRPSVPTPNFRYDYKIFKPGKSYPETDLFLSRNIQNKVLM